MYTHISKKGYSTSPEHCLEQRYVSLFPRVCIYLSTFLKARKETEWGEDMNKHEAKLLTVGEGERDGGVKASSKERHRLESEH